MAIALPVRQGETAEREENEREENVRRGLLVVRFGKPLDLR